jgi:hypothetical protein
VAIGPGGAHASAGRGPRPFSCSASRLGPFYTTRPGCPFFSPSRAHTSFTRFPTHFTGRAGAALLCTAARDDEYRVLFCSVLCSLPHSPPLLASSRSFPPCPREEGTARAPAAARPPAIQRTRGQSRASKRPHALRLFRF